ncbi:MAG TPA: RagB/SusD family nutrient uptake outer membrane protein [Saprospiraceae bacterium]|nr:RagB/SusD family nutrient uptake outer membrane protein [Saprospiraceae bacterium]
MKLKNLKGYQVHKLVLVSILFLATACSDILQEEPKAVLTPAFFKTEEGLRGGIIAAYSYLRFAYGPEGPHNLSVYGTDEFTNGNQVANPPFNNYLNLLPTLGEILTPWNRAYPAINTCNGVIEFGTSDNMTETQRSLVAEAKYIRAHWYFILARTFGGVTLDLGSGDLKFNENPDNKFSRATLAETYQAIINDLTDAVNDLPQTRPAPGRAWKATALHTLAKAYLERASTEAAQPGDYQAALNTAQELIQNAAGYGVALMADFADVHREGNDDNAEILFSVQQSSNPIFSNIQGFGAPQEIDLQQNKSNFFFRCFYENASNVLERNVRDGRPWIRFKPTEYLLHEAFNNKTIDSRYSKTFQDVWLATNANPALYPVWSAAEAAQGIVDPSLVGTQKFQQGDTCVYMPPGHVTLSPFQMARYRVFTPQEVASQKQFFPSMRKFNAVERPQPGTETDPNVTSYRPYQVYRFAETYLVAAEAAFRLGNSGLAAEYINVIRRRAAFPGMQSQMEITPAQVSIDFILDERSREHAGEQMRWFDLVRTGRLIDRVRQHNPDAVGIQSFHVLRPIPQGFIDLAVDPTQANERYPQNPGYN